MIGFEKTVCCDFASVGVRVPVLQTNGDGSLSNNDVGDVSVVLKVAWLCPQSDNVFAAGLLLTLPTGPHIDTINGPIHDTLVQPWIGYIWSCEAGYLEAFHSIILPSSDMDSELLCNDWALGLYLWHSPDSFIHDLVPTIEAHLTNQVSHKNEPTSSIVVGDVFTMTGGVHIGLGPGD